MLKNTLRQFATRLKAPRSTRRRKHQSTTAVVGIERLQSREMLSGIGLVVQHNVPEVVAEPGDTVVSAEMDVYNIRSRYSSVVMPLQEGVNPDAIGRTVLWVDAKGNDGIVDRPLSVGRGIDTDRDGDVDAFHFRTGWYGFRNRGFRPTHFEIHTDISESAESGPVGFDDADVNFFGRNWRRRGQVREYVFGDNPTHTIEAQQEAATLDIRIDGPAAQLFETDENDAVLATVSFDTSEALVINQLPILIETTTPVEDVELRNVETGRTVNAFRRSDSESQDVYTFNEQIIVDGTETWEIRTDIVGLGGQSDDTIRGSIINDVGINGFQWFVTAEQLDGGNGGVNITGGTISGNVHSIVSSELTVVQKTGVSTDTAVENERDLGLVIFDAHANDVEDLLVTSFTFEVNGDPTDLQNFAVWVDTDQDLVVDTILEDGVAAVNGVVEFDDPAGGGYVIPAGESVRFEVHGDRSSTTSGGKVQLEIPEDSAPFVRAEELDDGSGIGNVIVNGDADSTVFYTATQGSLYVTKDSTPLRPQMLLAGELSETILRLSFHAENESIDVTDLQFSAIEGGQSVDRLELYREGEVTPFAFATLGGCGSDVTPAVTTFCANMENRQLVIPEGTDVDVLVRARIKSDVQGGVAGEKLLLSVDGNPIATSHEGAVRARGDVSSNDLSGNDEDGVAEGEVFIGTYTAGANETIFGLTSTVVTAKISSITNANPDANGTAVPTGVSDFMQLKLSAAKHQNSNNGLDDIVVDNMIVTVNATNVEIDASSIRIHNKANSPISQAATRLVDLNGNEINTATVTGTFYAVFDNLADSPVDTEIDQGEDITLVVQADILNPNTSTTGEPSVLQGALQNNQTDAYGIFGSHLGYRIQDASTDEFFSRNDLLDELFKSTSYLS